MLTPRSRKRNDFVWERDRWSGTCCCCRPSLPLWGWYNSHVQKTGSTLTAMPWTLTSRTAPGQHKNTNRGLIAQLWRQRKSKPWLMSCSSKHKNLTGKDIMYICLAFQNQNDCSQTQTSCFKAFKQWFDISKCQWSTQFNRIQRDAQNNWLKWKLSELT